jgi:hypothetical protein
MAVSPLWTKYLDVVNDFRACPLIDVKIAEEKLTSYGGHYINLVFSEKDRRNRWQRFFGAYHYRVTHIIHMHDTNNIYLTPDDYIVELRKFIVDLSYKYPKFTWKDGSR